MWLFRKQNGKFREVIKWGQEERFALFSEEILKIGQFLEI